MTNRSDNDDIVQAAWLYHVGRMSQEEISRRLGISRFKVLRMLAEARDLGLVRISLEHETTRTLALARQLTEDFGLTEVQVAPMPGGLDDPAYARRAVGVAAAGYLGRIGRGDEPLTIGLGWGRSLAAMVQSVTGLRNPGLRFVSLMGSMAQSSAAGPIDLCARLADLTGGSALFLPAPFMTESEADCRVILAQRMVRETLEIACAADRAIVSLGECRPDALLAESGILTPGDLAALAAAGAVADTTGKFFCSDGSLAATDLNCRVPSVGLNDLRRADVTLLAAGSGKATAARAVLRAGFVDRLIADEGLAAALIAAREQN